MATNYPGSLDTFVNPASGNTLDSPSHSLQHSDINDAVEAIENKLGVGTATPGTATAYFPLVAGTAGATSWTQLTTSGITSGTATSGQVLTANGSGAVSFNTPTAPALVQVVPSSVAVGSGSGSANSAGFVTFTGASSVSLNGIFNSTYDNYRILVTITSSSASDTVYLRLRASGTDDSSGNYNRTLVESNSGGVTNRYDSGATSLDATVTHSPSANGGGFSFDLARPFLTVWSVGLLNAAGRGSTGGWVGRAGGFSHSVATSYDGLTIYTGSGTITGTVAVYGYRD
jgi:hypothetical protein